MVLPPEYAAIFSAMRSSSLSFMLGGGRDADAGVAATPDVAGEFGRDATAGDRLVDELGSVANLRWLREYRDEASHLSSTSKLSSNCSKLERSGYKLNRGVADPQPSPDCNDDG